MRETQDSDGLDALEVEKMKKNVAAALDELSGREDTLGLAVFVHARKEEKSFCQVDLLGRITPEILIAAFWDTLRKTIKISPVSKNGKEA